MRSEMTTAGHDGYVRHLDVGGSVEELGGKGHRLAELRKAGFPVPIGFVVTAQAGDVVTSANSGENSSIYVPDEVFSTVEQNLRELNVTPVIVRSSSVAEDALEASFAGMFTSILDVTTDNLRAAFSEVYGSLYQPSVAEYMQSRNLNSSDVRMAVVVQQQIEPWISGVCFTAHPVTGDNQYIVEWVEGRSLNLVSGKEDPHRLTFDSNLTPKSESANDANMTEVPLADLRGLVEVAARIAEFFDKPQDIEWAIDQNKTLHIVQSRPITTIQTAGESHREQSGNVIARGVGVSPGLAQGPVRHVSSDLTGEEAEQLVQSGEIVIGHALMLDHLPALAKSAGVISVESSMLSHVAIRARELGIPSVGGIVGATGLANDGEPITIDGTYGTVYLGSVTEVETTQSAISVGYDPDTMAVLASDAGEIVYQRQENRVTAFLQYPGDPTRAAASVAAIAEALDVSPEAIDIDRHLAWEGPYAPSTVFIQYETFQALSANKQYAPRLAQSQEATRELDSSRVRELVDAADAHARQNFIEAVRNIEEFKSTGNRKSAEESARLFDDAKRTAVDFVGISIIDVIGESAVRHNVDELNSKYGVTMIDVFTAGESGDIPKGVTGQDVERFHRLAFYARTLGELKNRRLDVLSVNGYGGMDLIRDFMENDLGDIVAHYGW
jgi:pyruvate, water dikinase